jgi:phage terminase large subunit-like protein
MGFTATAHPLLKIPSIEQIRACAHGRGMNAEDAYVYLHKRRELIIRREKEDPLRHGWEPPIWKVCDAILGFDREDYGWITPEYGEAMRAHLKFPNPVEALLIAGGNRGSKSEYAGKRALMLLDKKTDSRIWPFHSSRQNSIEYQHPLLWKYMPPELKRKPIRTPVGYISYKQKYGFSDDKFVLPNGSECSFRNYEQDVEKIEGGEIDLAWPDELVPPDWVETLLFRIATRDGKMIVTFTPVKGYTPTVKLFQDGAQTVKESIAFMCPKDGGEPDIERALVIEDCEKWLTDGKSQPDVPEGRKFEMSPRIMKSFRENMAVVFFHTSDNPYGNPRSVAKKVQGQPMVKVRERWYGIANKMASTRFPKFKRKVHCLPFSAIPKGGTNYLFGDPASGRNFYMLWLRRVFDKWFFYREWPGNYEIPGIGVPGPWALPDGKKHDGKRGPAQDPFGFGLKAYKREIARLEGWKDYHDPEKRDVIEWDEENGADEVIYMRYLDSRAASAPKVEKDRPVTLQEEFEDIGLTFELTPGDEIREGVTLINDLLDYDDEQEVSFLNSPKIYVCEDCINLIFSLQNWTGMDGGQGACKDPIDLLRYAVLSGIEHVTEEDSQTSGGGHY